jgi:hypothetical protein
MLVDQGCEIRRTGRHAHPFDMHEDSELSVLFLIRWKLVMIPDNFHDFSIFRE